LFPEYDGDLGAQHFRDIAIQRWNAFVGATTSHIEHDDRRTGILVISLSESSELRLAGAVPDDQIAIGPLVVLNFSGDTSTPNVAM